MLVLHECKVDGAVVRMVDGHTHGGVRMTATFTGPLGEEEDEEYYTSPRLDLSEGGWTRKRGNYEYPVSTWVFAAFMERFHTSVDGYALNKLLPTIDK